MTGRKTDAATFTNYACWLEHIGITEEKKKFRLVGKIKFGTMKYKAGEAISAGMHTRDFDLEFQ